ncbi:MAG: pyrophosphate--fructose 6-phosphate 1-phosphotransferase [Phycisphaerae bacterium]|nr:Pyrophosphate--fructose 6-phosphate 1-phosphotransferase [Phycisphaerales bacterium]MCK6476073.1 diphosphate--fructose-6-phosphate 1-phosphotransferase [Phycisphaerales bacterium]
MATNLVTGNVVIGQSGGPTAVINQSLVGVVEGVRFGLQAAGHVKKVLGMRHGVRGLTKGEFLDLTDTHQDVLDRLANTPSAGLGSTRDKPDKAYCERILDACRKHDVRYFFYIGGNDSSDTCRIVREMAVASGYDMRCFHVPKTVDNDLRENDHTPGFPSAARFVAMACMADFLDNISLPGIKINVIMGRHAGFLTAASALARRYDRNLNPNVAAESTDGPQLIYLPEVPFDVDRFLADVDSVYSKKGRCHIAVSEGIQDKDGVAIGARLIKGGQTDSHGNVQLSGSGALGDLLADFVKEKLTPAGGKPPRVRADTFGYIQRCWPDSSIIDRIEARRSGRFAGTLAMQGWLDGSVAIKRPGTGSALWMGSDNGVPYISEYARVELSAVAAKTRHMPEEFMLGHNNVSKQFLEYCLPLVGDLPGFERL